MMRPESKTHQSMYSMSSAGQSAQYIHSPACVPHFIKLRQGFSLAQMRTLEQEDVRGAATPKEGKGADDGRSKKDGKPGMDRDSYNVTNTDYTVVCNFRITSLVITTVYLHYIYGVLVFSYLRRYSIVNEFCYTRTFLARICGF